MRAGVAGIVHPQGGKVLPRAREFRHAFDCPIRP
jgi:hypothetical protein